MEEQAALPQSGLGPKGVLRQMGPATRLGALVRIVGFGGVFVGLSTLFLSDAPQGIMAQGLGALLAALLASALMLRLDGSSLPELGIPLDRGVARRFGWSILLGALPALGVLTLAVALGGVRYEPADGTWLEYLGTGWWALAVLAFPAAAEEVLFRGYPMRVLVQGFGPGTALLVTSLVFGYLHAGNPNVQGVALANIAIAGVFLGVVYLKTGSLWWATGAHLGWNFATGFLADLPVSGIRLVDAPLLEPTSMGSANLTGGSFGLEGGLLTTAVLLAATAGLARSDVLRPSIAALARGSMAPMGRGVDPVFLRAKSSLETIQEPRREAE